MIEATALKPVDQRLDRWRIRLNLKMSSMTDKPVAGTSPGGYDGTPVIKVTGVSKYYGKRKALTDVNISINRGEFVVLLGPNGAGKTTLFQLLTGLFVVDSGSISVAGHDLRLTAVKALANIGVVFQQPTLDLDLSVAANLKLHARLHGMPAALATRRMQQELERLELTERVNEPARNLSGGNKRKVELARSLLHKPRILLMDEASIGLDPVARHNLLHYVAGLCNAGEVGVLWATHLVDEVQPAHRVIVLHQGRIAADDSPAGLVEKMACADISEAFVRLTADNGKPGARP